MIDPTDGALLNMTEKTKQGNIPTFFIVVLIKDILTLGSEDEHFLSVVDFYSFVSCSS